MSEENLYTFENPEYRKTFWHTCSHIMAQAVKRLWPEVQLAIGPAIDEGWYYDFDAPFSFTPDHLTQIEAEMKKICKERIRLERSEKPRADCRRSPGDASEQKQQRRLRAEDSRRQILHRGKDHKGDGCRANLHKISSHGG